MATNDFETKFGILADATLSDKIPSIKKASIGFQVISAEGDNNEKAVGVNAYKIGNRLIYIPMFWLNGRCKGGDFMYLKSEDLFLPFNEVWVNFVETGKDFSTSEVFRGSTSRSGTPYRVSTMDLNRLHSKRAGEVSLFPTDGLEKMAVEYASPIISLRDHLSMFSPKAAADLAEALTGSPKLANAMFLHYSPGELERVLGGRIKAGTKVASAPSLEIITDRNDPRVKGLTADEKHLLVKKGVVIRDHRKEAAEAFVEKKDTARWVAPTEPGWYSILMEDLDTKEAYVVPDIVRDKYSISRYLVVFSDDKGTNYSMVSSVMYDQKGDKIDKDVPGTPVTEGLLQELSVSGEYGTGSFILFSEDGGYKVRATPSSDKTAINLVIGDSSLRIILTGKPGRILIKNGFIYIPNTARIVNTPRADSYNLYREDIGGSPIDRHILSAGYTPVKVASDGSRYLIHSLAKEASSLTYPKALISLIKDYGLRTKQASDILSTAADKKKASVHGDVTFYVSKLAEDYIPQGDDMSSTKETINASSMDDKSVSRIIGAAEKGSKEVLDTKILSEMAKSAYPLDRVKDSIPALVKAVDRLGRTLFMFYWHNEAFEDRYGKQNIEGIEDSLKDNIRSLGDLIIYLKEKTSTADETVSVDRDKQDLSDGMV